MDGIPNTPNDTPQPTIACPVCGAPVSAQARFCGACGSELTPSGEAPVAPPPDASPPPTASPLPTAPPPIYVAPVAGAGKVCNWCRAVNAPDAQACSACGATFPTPEGDEALERAARARIEDMQADINKARGAPWWPFRAR